MSARAERLLVAALAAAAALRVLAFSAAFPFFTNVDEHKHVDAVLKHSRGYCPRPGTDAFEAETAQWLGTFGSPEYHLEPGTPAPPPPWRRPAAAMLDRIERERVFLAARSNKEAYQPPVYYAVAGAWLRAGRALGLDGARLLYWVRGLGALGLGLLVLAAHRPLARIYPREPLLRLGLPALLAVFPQDAFTYVTPDALTPLLGGLAFLLALAVGRARPAGAGLCAAAGLATALACLAKYTNAALLGALALATLRARRARPPTGAARLVGMWMLALLPVAWWLARNQLLFGDPTATALKARRLGWEPSAPGEWLGHPLWSPSGLAAFAGGLAAKFWRGELVWHREILAWPPADWLYAGTALAFLACSAFALAARRGPGDRPTESAALGVLLLSVGELVALSLLFRFPPGGNPSAERPWFDHGRLIAGALVPFLVLYLRGLERATSRLPAAWAPLAAWSALALVMATALASEIALAWPVFSSAYNAYHLP